MLPFDAEKDYTGRRDKFYRDGLPHFITIPLEMKGRNHEST